MSDNAKNNVVRPSIKEAPPLEPVRVKDEPEQTRFNQRVAEVLNAALSGPIADRVVMIRDLFDLGAVAIRDANGNFVSKSGDPPRDLKWLGGSGSLLGAAGGGTSIPGPPGPPGPGAPTPPPPEPPTTPVNLQATASLTSIFLTWNEQDFDVVAYVEVWANGTNNLATAVLIGKAFTNVYVDAIGSTGVTKYYWIRSVGFGDDPPSAYNATSGVAATTGMIGTINLGEYVVTANKLADGAVTSRAIADQQLTAVKFAAGIEPIVVVSSLPNPTGYTGPKTLFLTTDRKIYRYTGTAWDEKVPFSDVNNVAITATHITDGAITTPKLAAGVVTADKIGANQIVAGHISAGAITANAIAVNAIAIGTGAIANGAIVNAMIGNAAIDDAKIANIDAGKITTGFINAGRIQTGSIDSRIAQIVDAQIQSLSAGKIVATWLSSITANLGQVYSGRINMTEWNNDWSYIRSQNKWWNDGASGFVAAGYSPTGSYFFDVTTGNSYIKMSYGPQLGPNAILSFNNDAILLRGSDGYAQFTNAYIRGNVEATSLNAATGTFTGALSAATGTFSGSMTANAVNAVNTINLAGDAVTVADGNECGLVQVGFSVGVECVSATVNPQGTRTFVSVTGRAICYDQDQVGFSGNYANCSFELRRNGATIDSFEAAPGKFGVGNVAWSVVDQNPGSGAVTYAVWVIRYNSNDTVSGFSGTISAMGLKR